MSNKNKYLLPFLNVAIFNPKGWVAAEQKELIIVSVLLMLIAVVPVFVLLFSYAWKYRASNKKTKYTPNWDHDTKLQIFWWGFLSSIIFVLAIIAWKSSHALDPRKPLESNVQPITIQVVALQWKWLFIYPEQKIATVNLVQFPEDTPINFEITADAPMNSFWIPQLGGQMYAMNGMKTKLHLIADEIGDYRGSSNNISGEGFAGMTFVARASSKKDFDAWVEAIRFYGNNLDFIGYEQLAKPSKNNPQVLYTLAESDLFNRIIMKFMSPPQEEMKH